MIELRKRGYTADEIEFSYDEGISFDDLVKEADSEIKEEQEEVLKELSDTGSDAYKELLNMTWLQGNDLVITDAVQDEQGNLDVYTETKTMNIDYDKVPPKGSQLFLKCYCKDYGVAFMTTDPNRWCQLDDSGNILVTVEVTYWNGTPVITSITEIDAGDRGDESDDTYDEEDEDSYDDYD